MIISVFTPNPLNPWDMLEVFSRVLSTPSYTDPRCSISVRGALAPSQCAIFGSGNARFLAVELWNQGVLIVKPTPDGAHLQLSEALEFDWVSGIGTIMGSSVLQGGDTPFQTHFMGRPNASYVCAFTDQFFLVGDGFSTATYVAGRSPVSLQMQEGPSNPKLIHFNSFHGHNVASYWGNDNPQLTVIGDRAFIGPRCRPVLESPDLTTGSVGTGDGLTTKKFAQPFVYVMDNGFVNDFGGDFIVVNSVFGFCEDVTVAGDSYVCIMPGNWQNGRGRRAAWLIKNF